MVEPSVNLDEKSLSRTFVVGYRRLQFRGVWFEVQNKEGIKKCFVTLLPITLNNYTEFHSEIAGWGGCGLHYTPTFTEHHFDIILTLS